ncbi:mannose-6-phosphate isomerase [Staphylococcus auricularis]
MPLFLKPVLHEKVWGGRRLEDFGYRLPNDHIGEAWAISAHPNGKCEIVNGPYAGHTLDQVWEDHRELFGDFPSKDFPLLVKMVDVQSPQSIQVHPDDAYAYENENGQYGKSESWYIIDAEPGAEIVYGVTSEDRDEAIDKIKQDDYEAVLNRVTVTPGEFYFIPAGTIHSIGAGVIAYETMQSSDVSYRIYDHDRDAEGLGRELNKEKALDVIETNQSLTAATTDVEFVENHKRTKLIANDFFSMVKWEISGTLNYMKPREFVLISVIDGGGEVVVDGEIYKVAKGSNFILTSHDLDTVFEGDFILLVSFL